MEFLVVCVLVVYALIVMLVRSRIAGARPSPMPVVVVQLKSRLRSGHGVGRW